MYLIGALLLGKLSGKFTEVLFALIITASGVRMLF